MKDYSYFQKGIRPAATDSSVLVSSSPYLNNGKLRDWLTTHFLRRNGVDRPIESDISSGLRQALDEVRDREKVRGLIEREKRINPRFAAWLEERRLCRLTTDDFAAFPPESLGGLFYKYLRDFGFQLNLGGTVDLNPADDWEFMVARSGQTHDFEHLLFGGQFNSLGEILPFFVRMANTHQHLSAELAQALADIRLFGGIRMVMRSCLHYPTTWLTVMDLMRRGISIGLASDCVLMMRVEDVMHLPLPEARARLGIRNAEDIDTSADAEVFMERRPPSAAELARIGRPDLARAAAGVGSRGHTNQAGGLMTQQQTALRRLLASSHMTVVPEAVNAAVGRLIEEAGFPLAYCGGGAQSLLNHAMPDYGMLEPGQMAEACARIAGEIEIPLLADADQGGETYLNARRSIMAFERAGVAGVHIEDSANPKHVSGALSAALKIPDMADRLRAAVDARRSADFVVIARTDIGFNASQAGQPFPLQEAIERGCAYAEAGADAFFCCRTPAAALSELARALPVPLVDINHPAAQASATGLRLDIFAGQIAPALIGVAELMINELKANGAIAPHANRLAPETRERLQHNRLYTALAGKWHGRAG